MHTTRTHPECGDTSFHPRVTCGKLHFCKISVAVGQRLPLAGEDGRDDLAHGRKRGVDRCVVDLVGIFVSITELLCNANRAHLHAYINTW